MKSLSKFSASHQRMKSVTETLVDNLRAHFAKQLLKRAYHAIRAAARENMLGASDTQRNYTAMK